MPAGGLRSGAVGNRGGAAAHRPVVGRAQPGHFGRLLSGRSPMRDVLDEVFRRWSAGETGGAGHGRGDVPSAPRPPGAAMLVAPDGAVAGSVSGGCVEGAVYELAQEVVADGLPVLQRYGVSDDDAFAVGLTCGGIMDVYVETSTASVPRAGRGGRVGPRRANRSPSRLSSSTRTRAAWSASTWWSGRTGVAGVARVRRGSTTRSPTTPAACWPAAAPARCTTARTASAAARACPCS